MDNARGLPPAVRDFSWWGSARERYFRKIEPYVDGFGHACAHPDKRMLGRIRVFDTTGRDGMQTPNAFLTEERGISVTQNKVDICLRLARWGIPIIEVGNAISSPDEMAAIRESVRRVRSAGLDTEIVSLARTARQDVAAARESTADTVHIFSSGSIPHAWVKFRKTPRELIPGIVESLQHAREIGFRKMVFSLEDAVRTEPGHLAEVGRIIYDICGDGVHYNIPDTVGAASPEQMFALISYLREKVPGLPLQVHCHGDMGRAEENTIAAMYAGVSEIQTTMHGLGERVGNAALERIAAIMYAKHGVELVSLGQIRRISEFITGRSGVPPAVNAPIVGRTAFWHESGVHANAVWKSRRMGYTKRRGVDGGSIYVPVNSRTVGMREDVGVGPLCGQTNIVARLWDRFRVRVPHEKMAGIVAKVKAMAAEKKVSDADFILIAYEAAKGRPCEKVNISDISVTTGTRGRRARVKLKLNGRYATGEDATGDGPVDVAVNAIRKALHKNGVEITAYECHGIGKGSDAAARATMTLKKGRVEMETTAVDTDIVLASIEAFRKGYNAVCAVEELRAGRQRKAHKVKLA
jgi:isopropylmalate/homocitrate/citramalate synthase